MADPRDCIETGRLLLEALGILQSREIFENFTEDVTRYMYPSAMRSLDEAELFVQKNVAAREQGSDYVFAVTLRESGEFLGIAALHEVKTSIPEVGIWIKTKAHGQHYGLEAVGGILALAKSLSISKVKYPVDCRNIASKKIPIHYGGVLVKSNVAVRTPDGRILQEEIYEIDVTGACVKSRI